MGFLIFLIYFAIAAEVAYGTIMAVHNIRKLDDEFLIGACDFDYQCVTAIIMAVTWPITVPICFAILFAFKKIKS